MLRYHKDKTDAQRSGKMARIASRKVLAHFGQTAAVADLTPDGLATFARKQVADGASHAYVARILGVIAAGLAYCGVRVEIPRGGDWLAQQAPSGKPPRRVPMPDDKALTALLCAPVPEPLFRWMLLSLATGARPEAVLDLRPAQRHDGVIELNPADRRQNKKHRPVVREPAFMRPWLDEWERDAATALYGRYVAYATVSAVQSAFDRLARPVEEGGLGIKVSAYSFRHKVVSVLRRAKRQGVTEDDIAWQMGHKRPDLRITGHYGELDPDWLEMPCRALDSWLNSLSISRNPPADKGGRRPGEGAKKIISNG